MKASFKQRKFGIMLASGAAFLLASGLASAGLDNSKHDFGVGGTGSVFTPFTGSAEICVFCHTPHGGDTTAPAPLWNRNLIAGSYIRYSSLGTPSFDAAEAPIGSISLACLSCHDGTQAMNSFINAPGSGNPAGTGTWTGTNVDSTTGKMKVGTAGQFYPYLGEDLSNDHPISMQYGGGNINASNANTVVATKDTDFAQPVVGPVATNSTVNYKLSSNNKHIWWVEANATSGLTKTDIPLYTRNDLTSDQPFVECASCHDPHNTTNGTFLRTTNAGSALCLTCHIK